MKRGLAFGLLAFAGVISACASLVGIGDAVVLPEVSEGGALPAPDGSCPQGDCVSCTTDPDSCPKFKYCSASHVCVDGACKVDADCPAAGTGHLFCTASHTCAECDSAHACPDGRFCSAAGACVECDPSKPSTCSGGRSCSPSGACVQRCNDGGSCPDKTICCGDLCIDPLTDRNNCGTCTTTCSGKCCAGACSDTGSDPANCGFCGDVCSSANATPMCFFGICSPQCMPGFAHCTLTNSGCETPTTSDALNCGGCGSNCVSSVKNANNIGCAASQCTFTCKPGFIDNDGNKANGCETHCGKLREPCCTGACENALLCDNNLCCKALDAACQNNADCCSNKCTGNQCR